MSLNTYTPDSTKIVHEATVDFKTRSSVGPVVHLVQFDNSLPIIAVKLYSDGIPYKIPTSMNANVKVRKPDNTSVYNPLLGCSSDRSIAYVEVTAQMCAVDGDLFAVIEVLNDAGTVIASSSAFNLLVDVNPVNSDTIESSSEGKSIRQFINLAQSYAIGGTGTRAGEDTDNAKYYKEQTVSEAAKAKTYADNSKVYEASSKTNADASKTYADNAKTSAQSITVVEQNVRKAEERVKTSEINSKISENNAKNYADEINDLIEEKIPVVYIDWKTRELMYSGGALTLWIDDDGILHWGND